MAIYSQPTITCSKLTVEKLDQSLTNPALMKHKWMINWKNLHAFQWPDFHDCSLIEYRYFCL